MSHADLEAYGLIKIIQQLFIVIDEEKPFAMYGNLLTIKARDVV